MVRHPSTPLLQSASRSTSLCPRCRRRYISTTPPRRATHYDTLSLPRTATRTQIKARFYKLSKDLHPDVNSSKEAKQKYLSVSEAYNVVGDERRRREYDRTLHSGLSSPTYASAASHNSTSWVHQDIHRRRGATYAWDQSRRNRPPPGPGFARGDPRSSGQHYTRYNDFTPMGSFRRRPPPSDASEPSAGQRVSSESVFWRVARVVGVVWLVVMIGGGWSAKT